MDFSSAGLQVRISWQCSLAHLCGVACGANFQTIAAAKIFAVPARREDWKDHHDEVQTSTSLTVLAVLPRLPRRSDNAETR